MFWASRRWSWNIFRPLCSSDFSSAFCASGKIAQGVIDALVIRSFIIGVCLIEGSAAEGIKFRWGSQGTRGQGGPEVPG